jgi:uncharacterized delta-60 repeat protein
MPTPTRPLRCEPLEDRLTPAASGELDPTFGLGGTAILPTSLTASNFVPYAATLQSDGRIIIVGSVTMPQPSDSDFAVVRLTPDGHPDSAFSTDGWARIPFDLGGQTNYDVADAVTVQPDGRIVVAGLAETGHAVSTRNPAAFAVARLTADGKLDPTFGTGGKATVSFGPDRASQATAVSILPEGQIVLGGSTQTLPPPLIETVYDWTGGFAAARLTAGGTLDPTFGTNGQITVMFPVAQFNSAAASSMAVQSDGRIVLAGSTRAGQTSSTSLHGPTFYPANDFAAIRLTTAGQLDSTFGDGGRVRIPFDLGGGNDDQASAVAIRPDGRIVLAGTATTADANATMWDVAARLNPNGQLDTSFDGDGRAGAPGNGRAAAVRPDGSAIFAGTDLVRLTTEGQLDPTFGTGGRAPNPYALGSVSSGAYPSTPTAGLAIQPDGQIVIAGQFLNRPRVTRILGQAISAPVVVLPGSLLVGGPSDGSARILTPTGATNVSPYNLGDSVSFFPAGIIVRTAMADVNGDGIPDLIGGAGPGGGPNIVILDGKTQTKIADFFAFENSFTGGVYVTASDINGDGRADVIVTPDQGGGPVVAVFDGAKLAAGQTADAAQITRFLGIDDAAFRGGARPALADVNGDGQTDLLVSAGFLGGPRIALYDGKSIAASGTPVKLLPDFFAFEDGLRNGAFVTAGDLTGDGQADLFFGAGPGGAPRVRVFDAAKLLAAGSFSNLDTIASTAQVANFFAGDTSSRGGVRLAVRDADGDDKADLLAGSGEGEPASVRVYKGLTLLTSATPTADQALDPFGGATLANGVFVG